MRAALDIPELLIGRIGVPLMWERWSEARDMLDPALQRSDETWPEVMIALESEAMQLWAVIEGDALRAAAVTRIAQTKRGEVVEVYLVAGSEHEDWLAPLNDEIESQSREIGCVGMRAYGRKGWRDPLAALGWTMAAVAYEKAFS